jgi:hypothetical protein
MVTHSVVVVVLVELQELPAHASVDWTSSTAAPQPPAAGALLAGAEAAGGDVAASGTTVCVIACTAAGAAVLLARAVDPSAENQGDQPLPQRLASGVTRLGVMRDKARRHA